MRIALFLCLWTSAVLPAAAGPQGCNDREDTAQITCAAGSVWDDKTASCVTLES